MRSASKPFAIEFAEEPKFEKLNSAEKRRIKTVALYEILVLLNGLDPEINLSGVKLKIREMIERNK